MRHIGFKDIGLPLEQLKGLMRPSGRAERLPIWKSCHWTAKAKLIPAKAAAEIGVDVLLRATRVDDVLPIIKGTGIQYFPFPGRITGHPSVLEGAIEEIVESAKTIAGRDGVHGLDLLAYRSAENVPELMKAVCAAVTEPVYIAGSIDTLERIESSKTSGAPGFTNGTAALDGKYPANGNDLPSQLTAIIRDVAALNKHLSPIHKKNLSVEFAGLHAPWAPEVEVHVNNMQIKVAMFEGASSWSFRQHDEQLFFVHRGRLLMKFRDREEIIEPGEFIVVPHGVEYCAVAFGGEGCEVLLANSATRPSCPAAGNDPLTLSNPDCLPRATVSSARFSVKSWRNAQEQ